jgi:hypothetical protein
MGEVLQPRDRAYLEQVAMKYSGPWQVFAQTAGVELAE